MLLQETAIRLEKTLVRFSGWNGTVAAVYDHAATIRTTDDDLISILTTTPGVFVNAPGILRNAPGVLRDTPGVPGSVHVSPEFLRHLYPGLPVEQHTNGLLFPGRAVLITEGSEVWNAALAPLSGKTTGVRALGSAITPHLKPPSTDGLDRHEKALEHALSTGHHLAAAVTGIIGCGNGLTPEGDDVLTGVLAFSDLLPKTIRSALTESVSSNLHRTGWISCCFLQFALSRRFGEPVLRMAGFAGGGKLSVITEAIRTLLAVGASSGAATLRGIHMVLTTIR